LAQILRVAGALANEDGSPVSLDRIRAAMRDALLVADYDGVWHLAELLRLRRVPVAERLVGAMSEGTYPPETANDVEDWPEPWKGFALQGLESRQN
ncbi:MAG: hypothetical protein KDB61_10235, partial [Planctomycetes bacterium]|nr:hypothetical protein [Planctomycetota bacterium]